MDKSRDATISTPNKRIGWKQMDKKEETKRKRKTASAPAGFERMKDLSARIGFSPSAIYSWIADEGFPAAKKLGRNVALYPTADVDAWLAERLGTAPVAVTA
jgi:predicted DNA-binding transcriptional regulator AlpA